MDLKLIEILDNRPSAIRNMFVIGVVRILAWLIGTTLFIFGLSILTHNFVYEKFLVQFINVNVDNTTTDTIGIFLIILAVLLFFVVRLCKMLIKRNLFLIDLDLWRYEWEKREKELKKNSEV